MTSNAPYLFRHESENYFVDPSSEGGEKKSKFPRIEDVASVDLSVIVPSYNEKERCKLTWMEGCV